MSIEHNLITDPEIHEPKGIASASSNKVYMSDGAGSGEWVSGKHHINGYIAFDSATPAYQHSATTSFTALNPTFSVTLADGFSGVTSPNARLVYTGTEDVVATCNFVCNFKNDSGTARDIELTFYKNGSQMNGGHIIVTANSGEWKSATLSDMTSLSTNDYIEIFVKASAAFTLDIAAASLIVDAKPVAV